MSDETSDLQAQVATLQSQVSALESKVAAIEKQLANMTDEGGDVQFPVGGPGP